MVDDATVRREEEPVPEPGPRQALLRVRYLSIDPTIRGWMNDYPGYLPPIALGEVVRSVGVAEVMESRSDRFHKGELVFGMTGWQDYTVVGEEGDPMATIPPGVDPVTALNLFGVNGMTAYFGLIEVGAVRAGDVVVVSAAAGATGSTVGQVARIKGAGSVVGLAGSDEKTSWLLDDLGFDAAINYKTDDVASRLRQVCPQGIDLYFDNVGGDTLDICLGQLAMHGRVVLCGAISVYNDVVRRPGPTNYLNLIVQRGRMEGFIILDYMDRFPEAQLEMASWAAAGRLKHREHIVRGLERAPEALNLLFTGGNIGKVIVEV
jgi:NADPH-dependent curcumin reductase CurA